MDHINARLPPPPHAPPAVVVHLLVVSFPSSSSPTASSDILARRLRLRPCPLCLPSPPPSRRSSHSSTSTTRRQTSVGAEHARTTPSLTLFLPSFARAHIKAQAKRKSPRLGSTNGITTCGEESWIISSLTAHNMGVGNPHLARVARYLFVCTGGGVDPFPCWVHAICSRTTFTMRRSVQL